MLTFVRVFDMERLVGKLIVKKEVKLREALEGKFMLVQKLHNRTNATGRYITSTSVRQL